MTTAVLRDVVARMTHDPPFIVRAQADRKRFLASLDLTAQERSVVAAFLQPRPMGGAVSLRHLPPASALHDSGVLERIRTRLATDLGGHSASLGHVGAGGRPASWEARRPFRYQLQPLVEPQPSQT